MIGAALTLIICEDQIHNTTVRLNGYVIFGGDNLRGVDECNTCVQLHRTLGSDGIVSIIAQVDNAVSCQNIHGIVGGGNTRKVINVAPSSIHINLFCGLDGALIFDVALHGPQNQILAGGNAGFVPDIIASN